MSTRVTGLTHAVSSPAPTVVAVGSITLVPYSSNLILPLLISVHLARLWRSVKREHPARMQR